MFPLVNGCIVRGKLGSVIFAITLYPCCHPNLGTTRIQMSILIIVIHCKTGLSGNLAVSFLNGSFYGSSFFTKLLLSRRVKSCFFMPNHRLGKGCHQYSNVDFTFCGGTSQQNLDLLYTISPFLVPLNVDSPLTLPKLLPWYYFSLYAWYDQSTHLPLLISSTRVHFSSNGISSISAHCLFFPSKKYVKAFIRTTCQRFPFSQCQQHSFPLFHICNLGARES